MAGGEATAGSVWNKGGFMWEEKSHTKWSKAYLKEHLSKISVSGHGVDGKVTEVTEIKGEASINVRRGKKVMVVDLTVKGKWEGRSADKDGKGTADLEAEWSIFDLVHDELEDGFDVHWKVTKGGPALAPCRALAEGEGTKAIKAVFTEWGKAFADRDGGEEALEAARKLAEEEARKAAAALSAGGEGTSTPTPAPAPMPMPITEEDEAGRTGSMATSEWNKDKFHWEERDLTSWAKGRFSELVKGVELEVPGGTAKVVNIEKFDGEAVVSLRKGKQLLFYEFSVEASWEGELISDEGEVTATGDGKLSLKDWDQDTDPAELPIKVEDSGTAVDKDLAAAFRTHAIPAFRKKLQAFAEEIRAKL